MGGDLERRLDFSPTERALLEDMLTRRGITSSRARLEIDFDKGNAVGGWVHIHLGARPDEPANQGGTP